MGKGHTTQTESFAAAFRGIGRTVAGEPHMKFHVIIALLALIACALLHVDVTGWCLVVLCIALVFSAELANTAVEALADKVCPEHDPLVGAAKDAAAGAVLVCAVAAIIVGLMVYIPALCALAG